MTPQGSFIVNGAERVIVSQLHRTPGICFEQIKRSGSARLFMFRIIPNRGSWLEAEFNRKGRDPLLSGQEADAPEAPGDDTAPGARLRNR